MSVAEYAEVSFSRTSSPGSRGSRTRAGGGVNGHARYRGEVLRASAATVAHATDESEGLDGEVGLRQFERERRTASDVTALAAKVRVTDAPDLDARYPAERPARLRVGGAGELVAEVAQPLGEPSNPIDDAALTEKVRRCAGPFVGDDRAGQLAERCLEGDDLAAIVELIAAPIDAAAFERM